MDEATPLVLIPLTMDNASFVLESTPAAETSRQKAFKVLFGIALGITILTSVLLMALPVVLRKLKTPFFIMLASWALSNMLSLINTAPYNFRYGETWTLGEFWCRATIYIYNSLLYTKPYLVVVTALLTAIGNRRFQQWTRGRVWLRVLVACLLSSLLWLVTWLPCIPHWSQISLLEWSTSEGPKYVCTFNWWSWEYLIAVAVASYIVPVFLTAMFLLVWACRRQRARMVDPIEDVQAAVLFLLFNIYLLVRILFIIFKVVSGLALIDSHNYQVNQNVQEAWEYLKILEQAIPPTLCLAVLAVYRRLLSESNDTQANVGPASDGLREELALT